MSWKLVEYRCATCGWLRESLERRGSIARVVRCDQEACRGRARLAISAAKIKTVWAWVTRGKSDEPGPGDFTTRHMVPD